MEINDLKTIWKKANDDQRESHWVSAEVIQTMIKKRSRTAIEGIKREMRTKIRVSSLLAILGWASAIMVLRSDNVPDSTDFFDTPMEFFVSIGFLSTVLLGISILTRIRYRQILRFEGPSSSLKKALINAKETVRKVIHTAVISQTFAVPLMIGWVLYLQLYAEEGIRFDAQFFKALLAVAGISVAIYFLEKWIMRRKFRHFIKSIDGCLEELEMVDLEKNDSEV